MITLVKKMGEFTMISFDGDRVEITDDCGVNACFELTEFEEMIKHYETYKQMKELDNE